MNETVNRLDRLYELLPAVHRTRDAEQGYPLKALLRVISEQVNLVEEDIHQLYDNWFIETAQDWVVPYLGDLIGYRPVHEAGEPGAVTTAQGRARNKILIPRREVANTIRYRRRKGALALLETLANEVAGWPARAVEFYQLLGWTQHLNHQHPTRGRTLDLRQGDALDELGGPFDPLAHTVDVRAISDPISPGRHNIPSVGLFIWRLKSYSVTKTAAFCLEEAGPQCYTVSVLGNDTPLYILPEPEAEPTHIAEAINLPAPIRHRPFQRTLADYYGEQKSVAVWADEWAGNDLTRPIPLSAVIAADLANWQYRPPRNHIAIDPVRGRIAFPPSQLPKKVRVRYHYAFNADLGGGEYDRPLIQPPNHRLYRVGESEVFKRISEALSQWRAEIKTDPPDREQNAVIEITDSGVYVEPLVIRLAARHNLQIRAANRVQPVIRLLDWQTDMPDSLTVYLAAGSRLTLDGLLITGRAVHLRGESTEPGVARRTASCAAEVNIRHCTLVPGWGLQNDCEPRRPTEPSLELFNVRARVRIEHSILGAIQIHDDEVQSEPLPLHISDTILDATASTREAIGAPGYPVAHTVLTIQRATVFGIVDVHAIELAENSIFYDCLNVARRQLGCMRFCYVPRGCRTPRRYHCQPDLAEQAAEVKLREINTTPTQAEIDAVHAMAQARVRPQFTSVRYGTPAYAQLAHTCAEEIQRGADDESELGVFHDLFQPQRAANLRARLDEYMPAGMEAGIIYAS
jgi:hypothetical protein